MVSKLVEIEDKSYSPSIFRINSFVGIIFNGNLGNMLGYSVMGRELTVIRLGTGVKEVHYNGAHHAREWMTSQLLMKFVEGYAGAYQRRSKLAGFNVRQVFETTTIWVVPMVNPDGVDIVQHKVTPAHPYYNQLMQWNGGSGDFTRWKANIRGVDLNRQYMANWIIACQSGPQESASEGYAGPFPESEPRI